MKRSQDMTAGLNLLFQVTADRALPPLTILAALVLSAWAMSFLLPG